MRTTPCAVTRFVHERSPSRFAARVSLLLEALHDLSDFVCASRSPRDFASARNARVDDQRERAIVQSPVSRAQVTLARSMRISRPWSPKRSLALTTWLVCRGGYGGHPYDAAAERCRYAYRVWVRPSNRRVQHDAAHGTFPLYPRPFDRRAFVRFQNDGPHAGLTRDGEDLPISMAARHQARRRMNVTVDDVL